MASIYNITAELEDIFLELEENGGELTPELEERLAITQDNLKSKLDGYRKAYTVLNLEAESCKKEEQRLAVLRKTKENNAERLKGVMLDAVIAYGDLGKSGNKVINLVDSKLYTKNSKYVKIDENLNQIFIDLVLKHLQSLWDNDMIEVIFHLVEMFFLNKLMINLLKNILNNLLDLKKKLEGILRLMIQIVLKLNLKLKNLLVI